MYTLGTTTKTILKHEEDRSINISVVSTDTLQRGHLVKLNTDGTVSKVAAVTDPVFGTVVAGTRTETELVTVQTEFNAVVRCEADGAIAIKDEVSCSGIAAAGEKLTKVKKSVSTNVVVGVALSAGATTESVMVGILRTSRVLD